MVDAENFKTAMRRLVGGVSLITTLDEGERYGLVASSVSSLTVQPATIIACVSRSSNSYAHIAKSECFCVNILNYSDHDLAKLFGDPTARHDRFHMGDWFSQATGAPSLRTALVSIDCRLVRTVFHSSHAIILGEVCSLSFGGGDERPLLYENGRYTTSLDDPTHGLTFSYQRMGDRPPP